VYTHFGRSVCPNSINSALRLTLPIESYADQEIVTLLTSTGSAREYMKYGQFSFEVNGEIATLQVYQDPGGEYFFLPFVDATAPDETVVVPPAPS